MAASAALGAHAIVRREGVRDILAAAPQVIRLHKDSRGKCQQIPSSIFRRNDGGWRCRWGLTINVGRVHARDERARGEASRMAITSGVGLFARGKSDRTRSSCPVA